MPYIDDMFPSNYLKASDCTKPLTLKISDVQQEEVGTEEEKELKPVVRFEGDGRGLVLNRTNAAVLKELFGDDTDGWVGKPITLVSQMVSFKSRMMPGIRIQVPA